MKKFLLILTAAVTLGAIAHAQSPFTVNGSGTTTLSTAVVIWNGRTFKALISPVEISASKAGVGGFEEGYDFTVKIAAAAFPDSQWCDRLNDVRAFACI